MLAAAAAQLKVFNCSDNKKIQKLSGHPVAVRCMIFSEDGNYILSSGVGERYVAIWKVGSGKTRSASCILSMEHPAISLDSKGSDIEGTDSAGLYVLAISEMGLCYFWYGTSIEDLRNSKPTKISLSIDPFLARNNKGFAVYAAKFQGILKPASGQVFIAYGSLIKPTFEKVLVQYGTSINLSTSQSGMLLPMDKSSIIQKAPATETKGTVTALDRANAEDAVLPLPKLHGHDKKRKHSVTHSVADMKNTMADSISNKNKILPTDNRVSLQRMEEDDVVCLEDRLRAAGVLGSKADLSDGSYPSSPVKAAMNVFGGGHLPVDANMSAKKIRVHILSMSSSDAYKFLEILVDALKTRSASVKHAIPWIYHILVNHGHFIISQDSSAQLLDGLRKMTRLKCAAIEPLLKLSGRFRLIMTQIDKSKENTIQAPLAEHYGGGEEEDEDDNEEEDVDELIYGEEEDESQSSGGGDN
ncbi:putative WD repeat-containing protein 43 [Cocos nucifera]|uniref:Putative WD repeat-containing protein 43 n=1 Tax=Cocos nucifera TaxID=13894 RepID=A0A8K0IYR1_COCNU|nr:putative WD repeat-containing protein 43 [Cocos nucifera]